MDDFDLQVFRRASGLSTSSIGSPRRVQLNDDEAEKRNRRRSRADRRRSNLIGPRQQLVLGRSSIGAESVNDQSNSPPLVQSLTAEELNRQYEEWMKIAADNKINTSNTWNFALIDYFHNMTLLREGDSINFQKASCTLDGCMKIYTSRVDSVATETGKLLSGLSESNARGRGGSNDGGDDEEDEEEEARRRKKKASRSENTLVKDFNAITLKKFDLEFAVDPLFKKTSADFDEGGAQGMLLNHLGTHNGLKIIFDASDVAAYGQEDEGAQVPEEVEEEENSGSIAPSEVDAEDGETAVVKPEPMSDTEDQLGEDEDHAMAEADQDGMVVKEQEKNASELLSSLPMSDTDQALDISKLKAKFLTGLQSIWDREICPSLRAFEFSSEGLDLPLLQSSLADRESLAGDGDSLRGDEDDHDLGDDFFDADLQNANFGAFGGLGGENDDEDDDDEDDEHGARERRDALNGEDGEETAGGLVPNFSESDFLASMVDGSNGNNLFSYFDSSINKNWAGPQHWKLLRPTKAGTAAGKTNTAAGRTRKEKEKFEIDFTSSDPINMDELFAPATASINLPKTHDRAEEQNILPDDLHFSARRLLSLFTKPTVMFTSRGRKRYVDPDMERTGIDVSTVMREARFTEDAAAAAPNGLDDDEKRGQSFDALDDLDMPIFNGAPGFEDDDDDDIIGGGFDAGFEDEVGTEPKEEGVPIVFEAEDEDYGDALLSTTRTVKPTYINYAKTAKRVDVKRLKDNIWRRLTTAPNAAVHASPQQVLSEDDEHILRAEGEQRFTEIIGGLRRVYPKEAMKDISVSFCFICLLHLANEKNLKITGESSLSELVVQQDELDGM